MKTKQHLGRRRPNHDSPQRPRLGVTLVELMIALTVLLVTVAGTLASQQSSLRLNQTAAETSTAMSDLQSCMEELFLEDVVSLPGAGSDFASGQPIASYTELHLPGQRIVPTYPGYDGVTVPSPLVVVLTATWQDYAGRIRSIQLSSLMTR